MNKTFFYKAFDDNRQIQEGSFLAKDQMEAILLLREKQLHIIHLEEKRSFPIVFSKNTFRSPRRLSSFCRQWSSLLEAGIPLTESLTLLSSHVGKKRKFLLEQIRDTIASGKSISDSFNETKLFPPFFSAMIRTGEQSGTLPEQLERLASHYEKEALFRKQIVSSLSYPIFVCLFSLMILSVVFTVILPSFVPLFQSLGIPLPGPAETALSLSLFLRQNGMFLVFFIFLFILSTIIFLQSAAGQKITDAFLFWFSLYRKLLLIRMSFTLAALLESGKPLAESLDEAAITTGSQSASQEILHMKEVLLSGQSLAEGLQASRFSVPLLYHMISVGMESGELPFFLRRAAFLLEEETEAQISRFRAILEPSLLIFSGCLTGAVILSVMLPLFDAATVGL